MLTILGRGGDGLRATWAVFIDLQFEYFLEFSDIYIAAAANFFSIMWVDRGLDDWNEVIFIVGWRNWAR